MTQLDPKFVVSSRPINRRTAGKQPKQSQPISPLVQDRLATIKARNRFGPSLTEQLSFSDVTAKRKPLGIWSVLVSVLTTVSFVSLLLAWIQSSKPFAVAGLLGLASGLAIIFYRRSANGDSLQMVAPAAVFFDDNCLQAFDRVLDQLAPEVPDEVAIQLSEIKQQIIRIARLAPTAVVDENFTMDDRMYLTESVRRYLPDSLQSYLMVPQNQRSTQILDQGQTAVSLLLSQINLLRVELNKQEVKLTRSAAGELLKQQRFLESKAKG